MKNIFRFTFLLVISALIPTSGVFATINPTIQQTAGMEKKKQLSSKAEQCRKGVSSAELNINNVRTRINIGGNMWLSGTTPAYFIPASGNSSSLYCGALWIGGKDDNDQLRVAAMQFGQSGEDFWPGPLSVDGNATVDAGVCNKWDKHFIITRAQVNDFVSKCLRDENGKIIAGPSDASEVPDVIKEWPAHGEGNQSKYIAPFFDADGDGIYDWTKGDFPYYDLDGSLCPSTIQAKLPLGEKYEPIPTMEEERGTGGKPITGGILSDQVLKGDQTIFWVFNDKGNAHTESKSDYPIGLEIRAQAFAFSTTNEINNMTFYSYEIINRSSYSLNETYFSQWVDADLGYSYDDYVGCDVKRGLGYCYNGDEVDGPGTGAYTGNPPAVGIDFFQGPYMDKDGRDNHKVDLDGYITAVKANFVGYPKFEKFKTQFEKYRIKSKDGKDTLDDKGNPIYDEPAISLNAESFYDEDGGVWYFKAGGNVFDNCAINGVNFGNGIVDDERFGMRRFVYHSNEKSTQPNSDPQKASDYYNYLRGVWKNNKRMVFGGNGLPVDGGENLECDFMFPGDSDPWNWGTNGVVPSTQNWTEKTAGNPPGDRRFMQSAGPFKLKPGAVNYITVGIPWAQAPTGGPEASVKMLRDIDDKCQALFESCFQLLEGPDAPTVVAQELNREIVLYLDYVNPASNNYNPAKGGKECYSALDPTIPRSYAVQDSVGLWVDPVRHDTTTRFEDRSVDYTEAQRSYIFEGYQIFQLSNKNVSIADIEARDITKVRLVAQCDLKNYYDDGKTQPIAKLINYKQDPATGSIVGVEMVNGANQGIKHSFDITEDMFAKGTDNKLVNNKAYYYVVLAYAQNKYKTYNPQDPNALDGQKTTYLASRKGENGPIQVITVIPHDPSSENGGTTIQAPYGTSPYIKRIEGRGNGGISLELVESSLEKIKTDGFASEIIYDKNAGPVNIRVIDPLNVKQGSYTIQFYGGANGDSAWFLTREDKKDVLPGKDTIYSDVAISKGFEQIILDLGISIKIEKTEDLAKTLFIQNNSPQSAFPFRLEDSPQDKNNQSGLSFYKNNLDWNGPSLISGALLGSSMDFSVKEKPWLTGVIDDASATFTNWIRSGANTQSSQNNIYYYDQSTLSAGDSINHIYQDYFYFDTSDRDSDGKLKLTPYPIDQANEMGKVLNGTWAPYRLVSSNGDHPAFLPIYYADQRLSSKQLRLFADPIMNYASSFNNINNVASVNIVITADKNLWTRCPVIEMSDDYNLSQGNAKKFQLRKHKAVDKDGKEDPNSNDGMGWFPGYAINVETGERLCLFFGEDSRYVEYGGADMLWNPSSVLTDQSGRAILGGKHYVYVLGSNTYNYRFTGGLNAYASGKTNSYAEDPEGTWLYEKFKSLDSSAFRSGADNIADPLLLPAYEIFSNVMWVGAPLAASKEYEMTNPLQIPSDVTIKLRVRKSYQQNWTNNGKKAEDPVRNNNNPMYGFVITSDMETLTQQAANNKSMQESIMDKIMVVPNPYYAASSYELNQLDSRVRITNLPAGSIVTVYTLEGNIVRKFNPTTSPQPNLNKVVGDKMEGSQTTLDWDLKNHKGLPIAGGTYLIYVNSPGIGDRIIKWFGVIAPTDLNSYN